MERDTRTKNTHLDLLRNRMGYATIYCPSFKPGDKILVRDSDLDQWQEGIVCEGFWHANFCTVDALTSKGKGTFSQFRPLVLEESEHFPVKGFKVKVIDGVIQLYIESINHISEIHDTELEDVIINRYQKIINDSYEKITYYPAWGNIPTLETKKNKLVEAYDILLFAKDEKHAKERVAEILRRL